MKVWALYSRRVEFFSEHELIDLFASEEEANSVRSMLAGYLAYRSGSGKWEDDEDFPDLYVRPVELRGGEKPGPPAVIVEIQGLDLHPSSFLITSGDRLHVNIAGISQAIEGTVGPQRVTVPITIQARVA